MLSYPPSISITKFVFKSQHFQKNALQSSNQTVIVPEIEIPKPIKRCIGESTYVPMAKRLKLSAGEIDSSEMPSSSYSCVDTRYIIVWSLCWRFLTMEQIYHNCLPVHSTIRCSIRSMDSSKCVFFNSLRPSYDTVSFIPEPLRSRVVHLTLKNSIPITWSQFQNLLLNFPKLQCLCLHSISFTESDWHELLKQLQQHWRNGFELHLSKIAVTFPVEILQRLVPHLRGLDILSYSERSKNNHNNNTNTSISWDFSSLETLHIWSFYHNSNIPDFIEESSQLLNSFSSLKSFQIGGIKQTIPNSWFSKTLTQMISLSHLNLSRSYLTNSGLISLLQSLRQIPHLQTLDLSGNPLVEYWTCGRFSGTHNIDVLPVQTSLRVLKIFDCGAVPVFVKGIGCCRNFSVCRHGEFAAGAHEMFVRLVCSLLQRFPNVQEVCLGESNMDRHRLLNDRIRNRCLVEFTTFQPPICLNNINSLDLCRFPAILQLIPLICTSSVSSQLLRLGMVDCGLNDKDLEDPTIVALLKQFKSHNKLRHLDISKNYISSQALSPIFQNWNKLTVVV